MLDIARFVEYNINTNLVGVGMNINELNEKNVVDALELYKASTIDYNEYFGKKLVSYEDFTAKMLENEKNGDFCYLFYDKTSLLAMATIAKQRAEIDNLYVNFDLVDEYFGEKYLEFVIKQFSAISRVSVWVVSKDVKIMELIENYGFEYTGEQEYLSKEHCILRYKYVFRRKK